MPARRNRPGKSGTTPLGELHLQQEAAVIAAMRANARAYPGTVYWVKDPEYPACLRLVQRGVIYAPHAPTAFLFVTQPDTPF